MHIAVVMLAPGQTGFYDDLSGIHLTLANREAKVFKGVNTAGLINAVQEGKIITVSGSLGSETLLYKEAEMAIPTYYRLLKKRQKRMLQNQIVKQREIREQLKANEEVIVETMTKEETNEVKEISIDIPVEVITEVETESKITEDVVEEISEVVPTPKKKNSRKKKESTKKED